MLSDPTQSPPAAAVAEHINPSASAPTLSLIITAQGVPAIHNLKGLKELNESRNVEVILGIDAADTNSISTVSQLLHELKHESKIYSLTNQTAHLATREREKWLFLTGYSLSSGVYHVWSTDGFSSCQALQLGQAIQLLEGDEYSLVVPETVQPLYSSFDHHTNPEKKPRDFGLVDLHCSGFVESPKGAIHWIDPNKTETIKALRTIFWAVPSLSWPLRMMVLGDGRKGAILPPLGDDSSSRKSPVHGNKKEFQEDLSQFVAASILDYFFQKDPRTISGRPPIQSSLALGSMKQLNQNERLVSQHFDRSKALRWIPRLIIAGLVAMFSGGLRSNPFSAR